MFLENPNQFMIALKKTKLPTTSLFLYLNPTPKGKKARSNFINYCDDGSMDFLCKYL